ncbi:MAG: DegT/DnrJ/EryC1/StrS family aminotransferase [bacterium]
MNIIEKSNYTVPLSKPDITSKEIAIILDVLRTPYLSLGPKLPEFERKFASYLGVKHAVAVSCGTAGLHLAVKSLDIGPDDAVITTPFSFISSANCILFENATPIFVDIEEDSLNIDAEKIEAYIAQNCISEPFSGNLVDKQTGKNIKAILPVHVFGHPCNMEKIMNITQKYNLRLIEDACEAIGAEYAGQRVGTFGDVGVFAFYPNKQITTGEGGMVVTNHDFVAELCKSMRNQGRDVNGAWLAHSRLGYNYRMSEIHCALGIAQLDRIDEILDKRQRIANRYTEKLRYFVNTPKTSARVKKSWFVYVVCLGEHYSQRDRDNILRELSIRGIGCSNYFPPIHLQPFYRKNFGYKRGDFPVTEKISERTIALSFYNDLKDNELDYVVESLKSLVLKYNHKQIRKFTAPVMVA